MVSVKKARNDLLEVLYMFFPDVQPSSNNPEGPLVKEIKEKMDALQQAVIREYYTS
jgi:hypothetical protein